MIGSTNLSHRPRLRSVGWSAVALAWMGSLAVWGYSLVAGDGAAQAKPCDAPSGWANDEPSGPAADPSLPATDRTYSERSTTARFRQVNLSAPDSVDALGDESLVAQEPISSTTGLEWLPTEDAAFISLVPEANGVTTGQDEGLTPAPSQLATEQAGPKPRARLLGETPSMWRWSDLEDTPDSDVSASEEPRQPGLYLTVDPMLTRLPSALREWKPALMIEPSLGQHSLFRRVEFRFQESWLQPEPTLGLLQQSGTSPAVADTTAPIPSNPAGVGVNPDLVKSNSGDVATAEDSAHSVPERLQVTPIATRRIGTEDLIANETDSDPLASPPLNHAFAGAPPVRWFDDELPEWWLTRLADGQRPSASVRSVGLSSLLEQAIAQSPRIRMIERMPSIVSTQADQERSAFDPLVRFNTQYRDDQEPVGNQLVTGGPPVLKDNTWSALGSVQRRFANGATADFYQRLGFKNSNSLFFDPQDQGSATIGVDVTQPLAFGRGQEFNRSLIVLAELQGQASFFEYQAELQKEMVEIGSLYWRLINARMIVVQTERSRDRAQTILEMLQARADYDTSANQISLAKAEVSQRATELLEAQQQLREVEISLRERINDDDFAVEMDIELIPSEFLEEAFKLAPTSLQAAIDFGLANRWELQREDTLNQAADRQLYISRCGLAPRLDLVLGIYTNGLAGDSGIEQAWLDQFGAATPGYYGGIEYEVPYGRRRAKAELQRDQLRKQQAQDAYAIARNEVVLEVRTAFTRVETAEASRDAAYQTVLDMRDALQHLQRRWESTALVDGSVSDGSSPSIALEQLLSGQRRLQDAENRLATADLQLALARQSLLLATGQVLQIQTSDSAPNEP